MVQVRIKRVYEDFSETDGYRVLVDKLWPRGIKKEWLKYDYWAKDITPSAALRRWFHEDIPYPLIEGTRPAEVCNVSEGTGSFSSCCRFSDSYQTSSGDHFALCIQRTGL